MWYKILHHYKYVVEETFFLLYQIQRESVFEAESFQLNNWPSWDKIFQALQTMG